MLRALLLSGWVLSAIFLAGCFGTRPAVNTTRGLAPVGDTMYFQVDLRHAAADQLEVVLDLAPQALTTLRYRLPAIVPGIYGNMNFGQFVRDFKAYDADGASLPVFRIDTNCWEVADARQLRRIRYSVKETWDDLAVYRQSFYRSAGSGYFPGRGFMLNHTTLFGFFEDQLLRPYRATFYKPSGYFGASARPPVLCNDTMEVYTAEHYRALADAPLLVAPPDTARFKLGDTEILVAFLASDGRTYARQLAEQLKPTLEAQRAYLGGRLPVDRYAYLIFFQPVEGDNMMGDALEHAQSSFYLFAGKDLAQMSEMVLSISAHEFFHIVTPLNIHSERIATYNFTDPEESAHLWLYEGMTEYATLHLPVQQGLIDTETFLKSVEGKYRHMQEFDPSLSLKALSLAAREKQDQYYNVYLRGALAGLCLDLQLRQLSEGRYGTQDLMRDLSGRYGPKKPFRDEALFDEIAAVTYPEIRVFFRRYVEGAEPLPLQSLLRMAGIEFNTETGAARLLPDATSEALALRKAWLGQ